MDDEPRKDTSLWYLLPVLGGFFGGIIIYLVFRKKNPVMAKWGFIVGIIFSVIATIVLSKYQAAIETVDTTKKEVDKENNEFNEQSTVTE